MKETTTIKIEKQTRDKLIIFKVNNNLNNMDEVINYLYKLSEVNKWNKD